MKTERQKRIDELRWASERNKKLAEFQDKVCQIIPLHNLSFLSFDDSDNFQNNSDDWPSEKWEKELFIQTEIDNPKPVDSLLQEYLNEIGGNEVYIYLMNYNFGLIKIQKEDLLKNWMKLIEIDGDEIYCYDPNNEYFICIEKTEEFMKGDEERGPRWIYEVTISNEELKKKLKTGI